MIYNRRNKCFKLNIVSIVGPILRLFDGTNNPKLDVKQYHCQRSNQYLREHKRIFKGWRLSQAEKAANSVRLKCGLTYQVAEKRIEHHCITVKNT